MNIVGTKTIVNIPNGSMLSLIGDAEGHILLIEPGYGFKQIADGMKLLRSVKQEGLWGIRKK